jgi:hypothetical protein
MRRNAVGVRRYVAVLNRDARRVAGILLPVSGPWRCARGAAGRLVSCR